MKKTVILYTLMILPFALTLVVRQELPEDAYLNFTQLSEKYGYNCEEHVINTEDGYIGTIFHIPGNETKPVLLMHGILDSADTFILRGRKSLAAVLSDEGYDVWVGNSRGNKYSRRHQWLDPNKDAKYWDFSFHEMAVVDLRASIDYILHKNKAKKISLIGHSQGNALFYVLGSKLPEYNDKIGVAIALGPIAYMRAENFRFPLDFLLSTGQPLVSYYLSQGEGPEIFGETSPLLQFRNNVCTKRFVGYSTCVEGIFSPIGGDDIDELEPEFFYKLMGHYPTSTSRKDAEHFLQVAKRRELAEYDYGPKKNFQIYKSKTAPLYDLSKVTMKVALLVGRNDKLTPSGNVKLLRDRLPNVVKYHVFDRPNFNHLDYIWGKHMYIYLFPHIFDLLAKYS